ncbi:MAG TPA: hypothetical protein VE172_00520 [Stackebrandtia sp.]|uniref:hypothetical protein n=1 Tax=Stackebrandtia sp. TaxID=2023065 RepID=UPI002D549A21|nr:hypothetical protein [Stackebrandtia sp.]HZE37272.1 hypothetical protein [Stackebrandtia sp.]
MVDGAVRLNRFGWERGKVWSTLVMALAIFAPVILWTQWNNMVSGQEELRAGSRIILSATPPPMAPSEEGIVSLSIPGNGWTVDTGSSKPAERVLVHSPMVVSFSAVAGVKDIGVLFDRKKRDLADGNPSMFTTDVKSYTSPKGLKGLWGDLTGERYGGALVVVGRGSVAAVLEVTGPLGHLDGEMDSIHDILSSLEVST